VNYYEISEETARTAHSMVHMSDYKPGSATDGYRAAVDEAAALVASKKAEVSPFYHDKLDALLDRYARRLAEWTNAHNRNQASYPSQFISGAGGYNMKKHNKQMAREDTLWKEYDEIKGILSKIKSVGTGPVDLADPHAREILTEQLAAYQKSLDDAKAANAFYRKNKTLDGCPFPAYELQSRRGYIKRVADRLAELDKRQAQQAQPTENEKFDGGEIVRNLEADRLQIIFDEKPDEETRSVLKSNGFRWSPRYGAWQRQLTQNAEYAARCVLKAISKAAGGDSPC
jgi:hypothetical protein